MDRNRPIDHLGVNKLGKGFIRKSPIHQPSFPGASRAPPPPPPAQPQPQVYNISKNDFRSIVQQLTGSPSHDRSGGLAGVRPPPPAQAQNPTRPPPSRLQRIRPPPLSPIARPPVMPIPPPNPVAPIYPRPPEESPISAYMRYLQTSLIETPPPAAAAMGAGILPTPPQPAPWLVLPSPTGQFGLPSPSGFLNLVSPRSPFPLLSPGLQPYPSPLTPNFGFPAFAQSPGILGPGPFPPPSPLFPASPSGFLPMLSPRWRE